MSDDRAVTKAEILALKLAAAAGIEAAFSTSMPTPLALTLRLVIHDAL